jgi:hypothetical protein
MVVVCLPKECDGHAFHVDCIVLNKALQHTRRVVLDSMKETANSKIFQATDSEGAPTSPLDALGGALLPPAGVPSAFWKHNAVNVQVTTPSSASASVPADCPNLKDCF